MFCRICGPLIIAGDQGVVVRIVIRLWTGKSWVSFPAGTRDFYFYFLLNVYTGSGAHQTLCKMCIGESLPRVKPAES